MSVVPHTRRTFRDSAHLQIRFWEESMRKAAVCGAGGFIGRHLVSRLERDGVWVRGIDAKLPEYVPSAADEFLQLDLRDRDACVEALTIDGGFDEVYQLASDMGGMGFIESNKALCMLSVLINTHLLLAARDVGVGRFFFASSACVYAADKQNRPDIEGLREDDAYPAMPEDGYGWEKLFSERMCRHFAEDFGLETRVARYHNVYGPFGTYDGGREKAPAAICRKVIEAVLSGRYEIEIWGDGNQTRSFTFVDDCCEGTIRLMTGDVREPLNIGSDEIVTINQLVDIVEGIAGVSLKRRYCLDAPLGVRGRNSDNTLINRLLGWQPSVRLEDGMERTYAWIYDQMTSPTVSRRYLAAVPNRSGDPQVRDLASLARTGTVAHEDVALVRRRVSLLHARSERQAKSPGT
jgi:nucleoside-diphosphate-sugar epimerase